MIGSRLHSPFRRSHCGGFTLIELLVVMGIIVVIAAVSIPAFRFITGSRSVDSGQNVVNAMMGRARTQAIVSGDNCGVFFFVDPRNDRSTLALVRQGSGSDGEYSGWAFADTGQVNGPAVTYNDQQTNVDSDPSASLQLVSTSATASSSAPNVEQFVAGSVHFQRLAAVYFHCIQTHTPTAANTDQVAVVPPYSNAFWSADSTSLEIVRDTEFQLLPQGVGLAVVVDPLDAPSWGLPPLGVDRYVRTGCVMFDGQGRFASLPYDVFASSHLGQALMLDQLNSTPTTPVSMAGGANPVSSPPLPLFSGFGVVLFDRQALLADSKINLYTEGDYLYGSASNPHLPPPPYGLATATTDKNAEALKEQWLDANSLLLTATRYNGAMTKGE
jgi:prepilin-type N-terminal cleavage/methylation domain-containing protein